MTEITKFDPAEYLDNADAMSVFMNEAFATGDHKFIAKSLGVIARAKGMSALSEETGLSREQLYRSFGERGNPTLKTLIAVTHALGIELSTASNHTLMP
jgi:probable addiction module antidote protein